MKLGLSMIVKDEVEQVAQILRDIDPYIDKAYITVTSKEREKDFHAIDNDKVDWSYFSWKDDFAAARNYNLKQVQTDFYIWLDSDDTVLNPEQIPALVKRMEQNKLDAIFLPYNYMQNSEGECVAWQERERIIRRSHPFRWVGVVHESLVSEGVPEFERLDSPVIKHNKTVDEVPVSAERNHRILLKEYDKEPRDPRITHYLGLSYFMTRDYEKAVELLLEHINTSGWPEEQYRSWCKIAEAHILTDNLSKANAAANAAIDLLPDYPEAYYIKVQIAYIQERYEEVIEWLKTSAIRKQPATMSVVDPNQKVRAMTLGVFAYMKLGNPKEAFLTLKDVLELSPNNVEANRIYKPVEYSYLETKAIELVEWLSMFIAEHGGDVVKLLQSLPGELFSDPRLNEIRTKHIPAKKWPDKSIVFFCGGGTDVWGADTLDKGMGGSEEAIVYLSRELAKLGWEVTVYNERDEEYVDEPAGMPVLVDKDVWDSMGGIKGVTYKPWTTLNPNDTFDVFVAWRAPENAKGIKARKLVVDLHDAIEAKRVKAASDYIDLFFVKSNYHRELFADTKTKKFAVIGNGIVKEQFK